MLRRYEPICFNKVHHILLIDITCIEEPPEIPTHTEYTLAKDDGTVFINSLVYPAYTRPYDTAMNSTMNRTLIPRNYMANLT